MNDEQYEETQHQLLLLAHIIQTLDLTGFMQRIGTAESIGPIMDPSLYIQASCELEKIKRIAQSAARFQEAVKEVAAP